MVSYRTLLFQEVLSKVKIVLLFLKIYLFGWQSEWGFFLLFCLLLLRAQTLNYYTAAKEWTCTRFLHKNVKRKAYHLKNTCVRALQDVKYDTEEYYCLFLAWKSRFTLDNSTYTVSRAHHFLCRTMAQGSLIIHVSTVMIFKH